MPELHSPYGYVGVMAFMLLIAIGQLILFRKMKWLWAWRSKPMVFRNDPATTSNPVGIQDST